eukprot:Skav219996  [mRNA]  locus=scaffold137:257624:258652:- [translate_table: standard]
MLADFGMLTRKHALASMVASSFLSQDALLLNTDVLLPNHSEIADVPSKFQQWHDDKMHFFARVAQLVGPWLGLLIADDFEGCIWWSLTASSLFLPFLIVQGGSKANGDAHALSADNGMVWSFFEPEARSAVAFVVFWRFFLGFGFHAFNMLLTLALSHAGPKLLASIGSVCGVAELVAIKVSLLLDMRPRPGHRDLGQSAAVASAALKVVALSRLSAFLVSGTEGSEGSSEGSSVNSLDVVLLLFSLFVSILAATLLSDMQGQVSQIVQKRKPDILHLERAADALAGVAGPLYVRSAVTHHGFGMAMAGIISLHLIMHLFIHQGLSQIISPFLAQNGACRPS